MGMLGWACSAAEPGAYRARVEIPVNGPVRRWPGTGLVSWLISSALGSFKILLTSQRWTTNAETWRHRVCVADGRAKIYLAAAEFDRISQTRLAWLLAREPGGSTPPPPYM